MTTVAEVKEGATLTRQSIRGYQASRVYNVSGVAGATQAAKMAAALNDAGLPAMNEQYPGIPFCLVSLKSVLDVPGPEMVVVKVDYVQLGITSGPSAEQDAIIEVGASVTQDEIFLDISGNSHTLTYTTRDPNLTGDDADFTIKATWSAYLPQGRIIVTRQESTNPLLKSLEYSSTVNSVAWRLHPGSAAKEWLCLGITGQSNDNSSTWQVRYEFAHATSRPNTSWRDKIVARDQYDGFPPTTLTENNEYKFVDSYGTKDFNVLSLAPGDTA